MLSCRYFIVIVSFIKLSTTVYRVLHSDADNHYVFIRFICFWMSLYIGNAQCHLHTLGNSKAGVFLIEPRCGLHSDKKLKKKDTHVINYVYSF